MPVSTPAAQRTCIVAAARVASIAGLRGGGLSGTAAYAASKGGVIALAKNAARVLAAQGIRVNTFSPGATDTPMIAVPLANAAHLSEGASFIHGANLVIDGGIVMP